MAAGFRGRPPRICRCEALLVNWHLQGTTAWRLLLAVEGHCNTEPSSAAAAAAAAAATRTLTFGTAMDAEQQPLAVGMHRPDID